ncbi:MAG: LURP-one-related family protein, partial [Candidatus Ranarchaeia archaeon]
MSILLNPNNMYYVIQEKVWKLGGGDILNEKGQLLGRMHRVILSLRADIELEEPDGTKIAKIRRKIISLRPRYDILDMNDNLLGCTQQKLLAIFRPKIWMEDPQGREVYVAQGNFMRWDFDIKYRGTKVAEIRKADRWR